MTEWRRIESRANYSPPKFPANREKYREYRAFLSQPHEISTYQRAFWLINLRFYDESEQGSTGKTGNVNSLLRGLRRDGDV